MNPAPENLSSKRVMVMGLGRFGGGVGVVRWLVGHGARVRVTDAADEGSLSESLAQLADLDIEYRLGGHEPADLDGVDLLIVNPAVNKDRSEFFRAALSRSIPWTTEINLFLERCPARLVGVSGTAGKSTTAAMIHAVLRGTDSPGHAYLGGNIGRSLLPELTTMASEDVVVLELSSFQLADLSTGARRPEVAVLTTVWPHHLDRHGSFESYTAAKLNMIRGARAGTPLVLGQATEEAMEHIADTARRSAVEIVRPEEPSPALDLRVPGRHNVLDARCAATVCGLLGVPDASVRSGLAGFAGLAHRLQYVSCVDGVTYLNDSKSTSPSTTIAALRAMDRPVVLLAGGKAKQDGLEELASEIVETVKAVVCFGEAGDDLIRVIERAKRCGRSVSSRRAGDLGQAVVMSRGEAAPGDVVLLSPGFPSFDAFVNYEQRGNAFMSLVRGFATAEESPSTDHLASR